MTITNEFKTRKIEFTTVESIKEYHPSHRLHVKIDTENIHTSFNDHIWVNDEGIEKFLVELSSLDESRTGEATLESMSPGIMKLTFKPIDDLGHLSVTLQYIKSDNTSEDYSYDLTVEFQIDPTSLKLIRNELSLMIKNGR